MKSALRGCSCVLALISLLVLAYIIRVHIHGGFDRGEPSCVVVTSDYPAKLISAHKYAIRDLAVTSDGRYCATVDGMAHGFSVVDLEGLQLQTTFRGGAAAEFTTVAISPDGGAAVLVDRPEAVYLNANIRPGKLMVNSWMKLPAARRGVVLFGEDGRSAFCGATTQTWADWPTGDTSVLQEWSVERLEEPIRRWQLPENLRLHGLQSAAISHTRAFFLANDNTSGSRVVWVCELSPSRDSRVRRVSDGAGGLLAADLQGRTLAVRNWKMDQVEFYDTAAWQVRCVAQCRTNNPHVAIDGTNGRYAIAENNLLKFVSLEDGALLGITEVDGRQVRNPRFTAHGDRLVASVGGCVLLVDCGRLQ